MYETESKTWIDEYGYEEEYVFKELSMCLSGHCYRGSSSETDSDCGNCDGGRCDSCHEVYTVTSYGPPEYRKTDCENGVSVPYDVYTPCRWHRFDSYEKAKAFYDSLT